MKKSIIMSLFIALTSTAKPPQLPKKFVYTIQYLNILEQGLASDYSYTYAKCFQNMDELSEQELFFNQLSVTAQLQLCRHIKPKLRNQMVPSMHLKTRTVYFLGDPVYSKLIGTLSGLVAGGIFAVLKRVHNRQSGRESYLGFTPLSTRYKWGMGGLLFTIASLESLLLYGLTQATGWRTSDNKKSAKPSLVPTAFAGAAGTITFGYINQALTPPPHNQFGISKTA